MPEPEAESPPQDIAEHPLDGLIRAWWHEDLKTSREDDIRADPKTDGGALLYLPFPYCSASGKGSRFPEMYGWDTCFINLGLLEHGEDEIVRWHIQNHLFEIERYGKVLNANRVWSLGRSQPPLLADSIARYLHATGDSAIAARSASALLNEYDGWWNTSHHLGELGLTKPFDTEIVEPERHAALACECETGLDYCSEFEGDAGGYAPLQLNVPIVRMLEVIYSLLPQEAHERERVRAERERRIELIDKYCWDAQAGWYFDCRCDTGARSPVMTVCGLWPLWAGIASAEQAERVASNLPMLLRDHGLAHSDATQPSPHPEHDALNWNAPAGWPPHQIIAVLGLLRYGYTDCAREVAGRWTAMLRRIYSAQGFLYEKYNVEEGSTELPVERYELPTFRGWTAASYVLLDRVRRDQPLRCAPLSDEPLR